MKVLHLSDLHIGHRAYGIKKRQDALNKNFTSNHDGGLNMQIYSLQPDLIILAGDLLDTSSATYSDLQVLEQWITLTSNNVCPVIGITGNHDKQTDSKIQLTEYLGIQKSGKVLDVNIQCANHMYRPQLKEFISKLEKCDILMLHQSMCGFLASIMKPEIDEEMAKTISEKCAYLALGDLHIHNKMKIGECIAAYPGTIDFLRVGEPSTKFGGWVIEEKNGSFLPPKSIQFSPFQKTNVLKVESEEDYASLIKNVKESEEGFFVIKFTSHPTLLPEAKKLLEKKEKDHNNFCFHFTIVDPEDSENIEESNPKFDDDFMSIVRKDKSIEESDAELASDLWNSSSVKSIQQLLMNDLKEEKEKNKK